jgi:peptidoglycan biosynthesis protein MviN/MurJ (putative lipid II flippase)
MAVRAYLALPFQLWMLRSASGLKPRDALGAVAKPLLASLVMGAIVWMLMTILRPYFSIVLIPIAICVVAGMIVYGGLIYAISEEARKMARGQLKAFRARR